MKFDDVKKLHQKKYRAQFAHYLVEGEHLILELAKALKHPQASTGFADLRDTDICLYMTDAYSEWAQNLDLDCQRVLLTDKQMSQLSDTKSPQGIVARVPLRSYNGAAQNTSSQKTAATRHIYLHEVQDPGNLGTILRSLAWFGGFRLLLSKNSVDPYNSKVVRASMGAIFHVPMELECDIAEVSSRFESFAYLDMQGQGVDSASFGAHQCYLFGNEARGIPHEALAGLNAHAYTIEGSGKIDSLNLASALNICVYELSKHA